MPGPAVYIVAAVGVVAVGFALKEFVFPHLAPRFEQWREENRARREARRRQRQPVPPHFTHEAHAEPRPVSTHEMRDFGLSTTGESSSSNRFPVNSGLRNRRSQMGAPDANVLVVPNPGPLDTPNKDEIPFTPLSPEPNPWSTVAQASRSPTPTPSQSPFEVGSESATLPSASPKSVDALLGVSRTDYSPDSSPPHIQLPTPSESDVNVPSSPEMHPDLLEWTRIYPSMPSLAQLSDARSTLHVSHEALSVTPHAPMVSRTATDMSASFVTAQSPSTDFRSFPPTAPTSPFSDSFVLSGDEDMYSFDSATSDSGSDRDPLPVFATEEGRHNGGDQLTFVVGSTAGHDDMSDASDVVSSGDFSDESWDGAFSVSEPRSGATSPRH